MCRTYISRALVPEIGLGLSRHASPYRPSMDSPPCASAVTTMPPARFVLHPPPTAVAAHPERESADRGKGGLATC